MALTYRPSQGTLLYSYYGNKNDMKDYANKRENMYKLSILIKVGEYMSGFVSKLLLVFTVLLELC